MLRTLAILVVACSATTFSQPAPRNTGGGLPFVSPDGKRIAFVARRDGKQSDTYVIDVDGKNEVRVSNSAEWDGPPVWIGNRVLTWWGRDTATVTVVNADGSDARIILRVPGREFRPSPNGKQLVFSAGPFQSSEIVVSALDGSDKRTISKGMPPKFNVAWSPNGKLETEPDLEIVGEAGDGRSAVNAILRGNVECCLLDIQMPEMSGFDVIQAVPEEKLPVIVFITAYDKFALRAFDAHAVDYVVKPFTDERLHKAMAHACKQVYQRRLGEASVTLSSLISSLTAITAHEQRYLARIPVRSLGKTAYVKVDDITWINAADYYSELHTNDGAKHLVREAMRSLEERLDPNRFIRVHRSAIVNIDFVAEVRSDRAERQFVVLRGGARVPLGRSRREALEELLTKVRTT